jgi:hypothetical protein
VNIQNQNDQLIDDPDPCCTQTENVVNNFVDEPLSVKNSKFSSSLEYLDSDLGDIDSGPMRPILKVSKYKTI